MRTVHKGVGDGVRQRRWGEEKDEGKVLIIRAGMQEGKEGTLLQNITGNQGKDCLQHQPSDGMIDYSLIYFIFLNKRIK
jgi:hypothetical protein